MIVTVWGRRYFNHVHHAVSERAASRAVLERLIFGQAQGVQGSDPSGTHGAVDRKQSQWGRERQ